MSEEKIKHTPGPWFLGGRSGSLEKDSGLTFDGVPYSSYSGVRCKTRDGKYQKGISFVDYCEDGTDRVASVYGARDETKDGRLMFFPMLNELQEQLMNCILITAAPDMLEALKEVKSFLMSIEEHIPSEYEDTAENLAAQIDNAINKAETVPDGVRLTPPHLSEYVAKGRGFSEEEYRAMKKQNGYWPYREDDK